MMSATFLLLYYLDMILYENFFTSFLPSDPPTMFPKNLHQFPICHVFCHVVPVDFAHLRLLIIIIIQGYTYTQDTHSVQIFLRKNIFISLSTVKSIGLSILTGEAGKKRKIFKKNLQKFAKPDLPNSDSHKSYLYRIMSNESLNFRMVMYIRMKANCFPSFVTKKDLCIR